MTPQEWNTALAPSVGWQTAYAAVEVGARALLARELFTGEWLSTAELVDHLWPIEFCFGDAGFKARKRMFKALAACAPRGLADCATRGPATKIGRTNRIGRPWRWHPPSETAPAKAPEVCPTCRRPL